jgi:hypothetical protein
MYMLIPVGLVPKLVTGWRLAPRAEPVTARRPTAVSRNFILAFGDLFSTSVGESMLSVSVCYSSPEPGAFICHAVSQIMQGKQKPRHGPGSESSRAEIASFGSAEAKTSLNEVAPELSELLDSGLDSPPQRCQRCIMFPCRLKTDTSTPRLERVYKGWQTADLTCRLVPSSQVKSSRQFGAPC